MNWLILHGLGREIRHWNDFPEAMIKIHPHARIHALDLPGFGREIRELSPLTIEGNSDYIRRRWKILRNNSSQMWGILGVSMGGMIAMDWAGRFPRDFERVVVINSSTRDSGKPWQRMTPFAFGEVSKIIAQPSAFARERRALDLTTHLLLNSDDLAQAFAELQISSAQNSLNFIRQLTAAAVFQTPEKIDIPVLILKSAQDKLVNPKCSDRLQKYFKADMFTHLSAGHDLTLDDGEWVAAKILEWNRNLRDLTQPNIQAK